jgi:hypothetical protein
MTALRMRGFIKNLQQRDASSSEAYAAFRREFEEAKVRRRQCC